MLKNHEVQHLWGHSYLDVLAAPMATLSCHFPQHCLSMEPLGWACHPHWQHPATHCQRWQLLSRSGAAIVSAEQRLSLQSLGYFWCLLLALFNTLSNYLVSGTTELLKKHSKQYMIMACTAVLLKEQTPICTPHIIQTILLKLEKKDLIPFLR